MSFIWNNIGMDLKDYDDDFTRLVTLQELLYNIDERSYKVIITDIQKYLSESSGFIHSLARNIYIFSAHKHNKLKYFINLIKDLEGRYNIINILKGYIYYGFLVDSRILIKELESIGYFTHDEVEIAKSQFLFNKIELDPKYDLMINAIQHDDLEDLQSITSSPEFNLNIRFGIENPESQDPLLNLSHTFIQHACFFGSIRCFKYFMMNDADMTINATTKRRSYDSYPTTAYAIAGGNTEIIRILEQNEIHPKIDDIQYAISHHHADIYFWLLEMFQNQIAEDTLYKCIEHEFIPGFLEFNQINDMQRAFDIACKVNLIELVDYILSQQEVYLSKGLSYACLSNYVFLAKKLLKYDSLDINQSDGGTPLLNACICGSYELVELILKYPGVDINVVDIRVCLLLMVTLCQLHVLEATLTLLSCCWSSQELMLT